MKFVHKKRHIYYYKRKIIWNHWLVAFRIVSFLLFPLWDWTPCISALTSRILKMNSEENRFWILGFLSPTKMSCNQFFAFRLIWLRVFGVPHMQLNPTWPVRVLHTQICVCPSIVSPCIPITPPHSLPHKKVPILQNFSYILQIDLRSLLPT